MTQLARLKWAVVPRVAGFVFVVKTITLMERNEKRPFHKTVDV